MRKSAELYSPSKSGPIARTVKAVMCSFVGLRTRRDSEQDLAQLNPVHVVVVGFVGVFVFVGSLVLLAAWMAAN